MQEVLELLCIILFSILNSRTTEFERLSLVHYLSFILEFEQVLKVHLHPLHVHPHKLGWHLAERIENHRPRVKTLLVRKYCSPQKRPLVLVEGKWIGHSSAGLEVDLQCSEMVTQFDSRNVQIREVDVLNIYQEHALLLELGGSIFHRSFISHFAAPKMISCIPQAFG